MVFMGYPEKIGVTFLGLLERKKVSPKKSRFTSVDSEISEFFYFCFWKRTDSDRDRRATADGVAPGGDAATLGGAARRHLLITPDRFGTAP